MDARIIKDREPKESDRIFYDRLEYELFANFLFSLFEMGIDINQNFKEIMEDYLEKLAEERPILE